MKREKFVQEAKLEPARYYRTPTDILRDRRLTNLDRLEILGAWERITLQAGDPPSTEDESRLEQIRRVRSDVEAALSPRSKDRNDGQNAQNGG